MEIMLRRAKLYKILYRAKWGKIFWKKKKSKALKFIVVVLKFVYNSGCENNEIQCNNGGSCIPRSYQCDGFLDCPDGADESEELCFTNWIQPKGTDSFKKLH